MFASVSVCVLSWQQHHVFATPNAVHFIVAALLLPMSPLSFDFSGSDNRPTIYDWELHCTTKALQFYPLASA